VNLLKTIIHFTRFLILFVFLVNGSCDAEKQQRIQFEEQFIKTHDYYMLDSGIVDANRDGFLDIYTVNHTALSSLLLGNGRGTFRDVYGQWGLHHQEEFPGLEDSLDEPEIRNEPGLYIYWKERQIHIKFISSIKSVQSASGYLTLHSPVNITTHLNCEATATTSLLPPQIRKSDIRFKFDPEKSNGLLVIQPDMAAVPVSFQIKSQIPLSRIHVGRHKQNPSSYHFVLKLKDRHGMAWGDWNGDHLMDLAISNGRMEFVRKSNTRMQTRSCLYPTLGATVFKPVFFEQIKKDRILDLKKRDRLLVLYSVSHNLIGSVFIGLHHIHRIF